MSIVLDSSKSSTSNVGAVAALQTAYSMVLEAVANDLANSVNLDGVRAEDIKKTLANNIQERLRHATGLAARIKQLHGRVPGSADLEFSHSHLSTANETTDAEHVVRQVIADGQAAIEHLRAIINDTDGWDFVTQGLCIGILADEEQQLAQFESFLREYTEH